MLASVRLCENVVSTFLSHPTVPFSLSAVCQLRIRWKKCWERIGKNKPIVPTFCPCVCVCCCFSASLLFYFFLSPPPLPPLFCCLLSKLYFSHVEHHTVDMPGAACSVQENITAQQRLNPSFINYVLLVTSAPRRPLSLTLSPWLCLSQSWHFMPVIAAVAVVGQQRGGTLSIVTSRVY